MHMTAWGEFIRVRKRAEMEEVALEGCTHIAVHFSHSVVRELQKGRAPASPEHVCLLTAAKRLPYLGVECIQ